MRAFVTVLLVALIWVAAFILGYNTWIWAGLIFGIAINLFFIYFGIRVVPADPPHMAIMMFLGRRLKKVLYEGWNFLPLAPIIFDAINIKVVKINQDLSEQKPRTPDYAEIGISVSITWTPGRLNATSKEKAEALIEFLNSGGEAGVKQIIEDVIRDRLRAWSFSGEEGPANWEEAIGARNDAIAVLLKAILGDDLPPIRSDIPTPVLLKYFNRPRHKPLHFEEEWGKNNWEKLTEELSELTPNEYKELEEDVEERRKIIQKVREGNGFFYKKALGITINRFTINEIVLRGKTAEAVDSAVQERYEEKADETEIRNVLRRAQELIEGINISPEQALEVVQTERRKVIKSIQENKFNISPETRQMIEVLPKLFRWIKKD
jgi:hypothetical protein